MMIGDFTTFQRRSFSRTPAGKFRCSMCKRLTTDPIGHGARGTCFSPVPTCEIRACQLPILAPGGVVFGSAGGATREAHALCYLRSQGEGIVWLW